MNFSSLLGFFLAYLILKVGVIDGSARPEIFLDPHAIMIVLGGTVAAALIAFPFSRLLGLVKIFIFGVLLKIQTNNRKLIDEILFAAATAKENIRGLHLMQASHPFLQEGLLLLMDERLSEKALTDILQFRLDYYKKRYQADSKLLHSLGKFPPAFGLLGASTGMITMMTKLGQGGQETIGPSMAVALVATFWGIGISNFILLPLADYTSRLAQDDTFTRQIIFEAILMIKRKESNLIIFEKLNSFVAAQKRFTLRKSSVRKEPDIGNDQANPRKKVG